MYNSKRYEQKLKDIYCEAVDVIKCLEQQLELVLEYANLAFISELSDMEVERMGEILELAQHNECLSFLINEIDYFVLQEMHLLNDENLSHYKEQEDIIINSLDKMCNFYDKKNTLSNELNDSENSNILDEEKTSVKLLCLIQEYENPLVTMKKYKYFMKDDLLSYYEKHVCSTIKEYYKLAKCPNISELEAERMGEILELAQHNECLSILVNEVDYLVSKELDLLDKDSIYSYNNQEARIKEFLPTINTETENFNHANNDIEYENSNEEINQEKQELEQDLRTGNGTSNRRGLGEHGEIRFSINPKIIISPIKTIDYRKEMPGIVTFNFSRGLNHVVMLNHVVSRQISQYSGWASFLGLMPIKTEPPEYVCCFHSFRHGKFPLKTCKYVLSHKVVGTDNKNNPRWSNIIFNVAFDSNVLRNSKEANFISSASTKSNNGFNPHINQEFVTKVYQEWLRQARRSFNLAFSMTTISVIAGFTGIMLLLSGNISAGTITSAIGGIYCGVTVLWLKLAKDSNDRLGEGVSHHAQKTM